MKNKKEDMKIPRRIRDFAKEKSILHGSPATVKKTCFGWIVRTKTSTTQFHIDKKKEIKV
jgi:hypothetical protein